MSRRCCGDATRDTPRVTCVATVVPWPGIPAGTNDIDLV